MDQGSRPPSVTSCSIHADSIIGWMLRSCSAIPKKNPTDKLHEKSASWRGLQASRALLEKEWAPKARSAWWFFPHHGDKVPAREI